MMSEKGALSSHLNRKKRSEKQYKRVSNSDEVKLGHYILPNDTRKIIEKKYVIDRIDNYALKLNKVSYFDSKDRSYNNDKDEKFKFFEAQKGKVILNVEPNFSGINFLALVERQRDSLQSLGLNIKQGNYKTEWKVAVGLGNESVYETSITLHHIYGIPYIPGSSIKGVIRSHIILEKFGKDKKNGNLDLKNAENRALSDQGFCDIFGCPKNSFYEESRQGKIIFFDAFPLSEPKIEPEIMNPHFGSYYSDNLNKTPPADYHDPKPIFFLVIKDTEYEFAVGIKEIHDTNIPIGAFKGETPLSAVCYWMEKTLKEHGIGAKSSVGYGYFEKIEASVFER